MTGSRHKPVAGGVLLARLSDPGVGEAVGVRFFARLPRRVAEYTDTPGGQWSPIALTHVLSFGLRIRPVRRLLARMRWPRPEHLAKMSPDQFRGYVRAIGLEAEAQAALAEYRGEQHHTAEADPGVPSAEGITDRRPGAALP